MRHRTAKSHDIEIQHDDVANIKLPEFDSGKIKENVKLREVIDGYKVCEVVLDFLEDGTLAGIEIIA